MNRNVESHFASNPTSLDMNRSQFDRSSGVKLSGNVGDIIPFYVEEVLPGDTFKVTDSKVVRFQTMLKPVMDNCYLDTYYFFVPNRLVWNHWKNFMGESNKAWLPDVEYNIPQLHVPASGFDVGSLADYMGIGPNVKDYKISALPFRAYAKIMDDWFRDENLTDPLVIDYGDADTEGNSKSDPDIYCAKGGPVFRASKYHDYFTSCLPAPQAGPSVTIPLGNVAKVGAGEKLHSGYLSGSQMPTVWQEQGHSDTHRLHISSTNNVTSSNNTAGSSGIVPVNLYADLSTATATTINELRLAFQIQRYYEKAARGGRRYIEILKTMFGVTSPDARQQRSEYLGGNRVPLNVHEVTNNAKSENDNLGDLGAISHTSDISESFVKSFTEHGYVIGVLCVRYDHTYGQGIDPMFLRKTLFEFYNPVFANIGETAVRKIQLYFDPQHNDEVFGYQEAWAEYRYKPSRVCGEMRPEVPNTLASWHLADDYASVPYLSDAWIREDKTNVDRTLAVTSQVANQFFADVYVQNICTRVMPMYSIPGLIDHH